MKPLKAVFTKADALVTRLSRSKYLRQIITVLCWPMLTVMIVIAISRMLEVAVWPIELAYHFFFHFAVAAVLIACGFAFVQRWRALAISAATAVYLASVAVQPSAVDCHVVLPYSNSRDDVGPPSPPSAQRVRLYTQNLHFSHTPSHWTQNALSWVQADILAFQEINSAVFSTFRAIDRVFPHRVFLESLRDPKEQLAILSTQPITEYRIFKASPHLSPAIFARVVLSDGISIWLVVVHAPNPIVAKGKNARDHFFKLLAEKINQIDGPVIVAGDFNATPYTPPFRKFVENARIAEACLTPATFPKAGNRLGLPIDHILVRDGTVRNLMSSRLFGSDHLALVGEIQLNHD